MMENYFIFGSAYNTRTDGGCFELLFMDGETYDTVYDRAMKQLEEKYPEDQGWECRVAVYSVLD